MVPKVWILIHAGDYVVKQIIIEADSLEKIMRVILSFDIMQEIEGRVENKESINYVSFS